MSAVVEKKRGVASAGSAVFSACGQYRYLLTRRLTENGSEHGCEPNKMATFIMLNPSTADATRNDPTIRRCIGFAQQWACGTLQVLNLFAVRATLPQTMKQTDDPVGPENQQWFERVLRAAPVDSHIVVCAWGVHGAFRGQDRVVLGWLRELGIASFALGVTRDGHPCHPLYLPYSAELVQYTREGAWTP
jgi:hypothetical protein